MIKHEFTITVALSILAGLLLIGTIGLVLCGADKVLTDWFVYGLLSSMFVLGIFKGVIVIVKVKRKN